MVWSGEKDKCATLAQRIMNQTRMRLRRVIPDRTGRKKTNFSSGKLRKIFWFPSLSATGVLKPLSHLSVCKLLLHHLCAVYTIHPSSHCFVLPLCLSLSLRAAIEALLLSHLCSVLCGWTLNNGSVGQFHLLSEDVFMCIDTMRCMRCISRLCGFAECSQSISRHTNGFKHAKEL